MRDRSLSRRSALALALGALALPTVSKARFAPPPAAKKLAEQTVELSDRGVIWQANTLRSLPADSLAWPFHAGFLAALDDSLSLLDVTGTPLQVLNPGEAMPVPEETYLAATADQVDTPYLAIEIVGQDDSDRPYRRPFKTTPGQYTLTLWSISVDAGSDGDIAGLLGENQPGAPVMIAVRTGGVAVATAGGELIGQILQGNWDAVDPDSEVTVPGAVTSELLIATISAPNRGSGGDDDLGGGEISASTTSSPSSIVETSFPGITQVNYRSTSLDAGDLTWQIVTGSATQTPEELRYQRGFIVALNGAIALAEEDGTFRRVGGGNAITVRNGDRFSAQSLTTQDEPFVAIELLATADASDSSAPSFAIQDGKFTFELWRADLLEENVEAFGVFMQDTPFASLFFIQRGQLQITPAGGGSSQLLAAGLSQVVAAGATFEMTGPSASLLVARLIPL